jgi:hypothetical protein
LLLTLRDSLRTRTAHTDSEPVGLHGSHSGRLTGLGETFDFDLTWAPDLTTPSRDDAGPGGVITDSDGPSFNKIGGTDLHEKSSSGVRNETILLTDRSTGVRFEVQRVQPLFAVLPVRQAFALRLPFIPYDVPDGQRFLINSVDEASAAAPGTLVVNWPGLLKK